MVLSDELKSLLVEILKEVKELKHIRIERNLTTFSFSETRKILNIGHSKLLQLTEAGIIKGKKVKSGKANDGFSYSYTAAAIWEYQNKDTFNAEKSLELVELIDVPTTEDLINKFIRKKAS